MTTTIRVSKKFQVVIPKEVREAAGIKTKQELVVWAEMGRVQMMPLKRYKHPTKELEKLAKGEKIALRIAQLEREIEKGIEE